MFKESTIFVDKSMFIKEILEYCNYVTLITMPRCWGKSSNLEMLKRFLSFEVDAKTGAIIPRNQTYNYKLFAGGNIEFGLGATKKLEK